MNDLETLAQVYMSVSKTQYDHIDPILGVMRLEVSTMSYASIGLEKVLTGDPLNQRIVH